MIKVYCVYFLQLLLMLDVCVNHVHKLNEEDYWQREQERQDPSSRFSISVDHLVKHMLPPGASCDPVKHFDAILLHHSVRHGLLEISETAFLEIISGMCAVIKETDSLKFYQTYRCLNQTCVCPYDFLTWSRSEQKCKVRASFNCGNQRLFNETFINLNKVFGCEAGTSCIRENIEVTTITNGTLENEGAADTNNNTEEVKTSTDYNTPEETKTSGNNSSEATDSEEATISGENNRKKRAENEETSTDGANPDEKVTSVDSGTHDETSTSADVGSPDGSKNSTGESESEAYPVSEDVAIVNYTEKTEESTKVVENFIETCVCMRRSTCGRPKEDPSLTSTSALVSRCSWNTLLVLIFLSFFH